jgi:hypothetical protein
VTGVRLDGAKPPWVIVATTVNMMNTSKRDLQSVVALVVGLLLVLVANY